MLSARRRRDAGLRLRVRIARRTVHAPIRYLALVMLVTVVLGAGLPRVQIATVLSDLLPTDHPFVHIYREHPSFGSPLTVLLMIRRIDGTIYHADTLAKIWRLTRGVDPVAGVDHDQLLSIATEKVRVATATPFGVEAQPVMGDHPPATAGEIAVFRDRVARAPGVVGFLVSADHTAALIRAPLTERNLDYRTTFAELRALLDGERDTAHELHLAGRPTLIGWVHHHGAEMMRIFALTVAAMVLALVVYTRSLGAVLTPLIVSAVSGVWALGLWGWIGHPLEPLTMVVPMLLVARSFSHCVQVSERFDERLATHGHKRLAARQALESLLAPGTLGILTDAAALFAIGITPIPLMEKLAAFCGFWALTLLPANVLLTPVLLSLLPARAPPAGPGGGASVPARAVARVLAAVAATSRGARGRWTAVGVIAGSVVIGALGVPRIDLGVGGEGSALLWPGSEFNVAKRAINRHLAGSDTLEIVLDGDAPSAMRRAQSLHTMVALQRELEANPDEGAVTLSFADYLPEVNRIFSGGNPKWLPLDDDDRRLQGPINALLLGTNVQDFGHVVDLTLEDGTVSVWARDLRAASLESLLQRARRAVAAVGEQHEAFRIRLGAGTAALQQAVNERVFVYERVIAATLVALVFVASALAYRSLAAGAVLVASVVCANLLLGGYMAAFGVSLDVHTMPVTALGIGIGIDYGIYMLSRIREEVRHGASLPGAVERAVATTGKAVAFTALVVLVGLAPWYFLSGLRFQAEMGLLLGAVMAINMLVALVLVPSLAQRLGPRLHLGAAA